MMNRLTPGSNMLWESSRMILPEHKEAYLEYLRKKKKLNETPPKAPIEATFDDLMYDDFILDLHEMRERYGVE